MAGLPSDNIRRLRLLKGITQRQLAVILGVSSKTVSKWETGTGQPTIDQIVSLAQVFGVSTDELLLGPKPFDASEKSIPNETRSIQKVLERLNVEYKISPDFLLQTVGADTSDLKDYIEGKTPSAKEKMAKRKRLVKLIIVINDLIPRYVRNNKLLISDLFEKLTQENGIRVETIEKLADLTHGSVCAFLSGEYPLSLKATCALITVMFMLDVSINQEEAFPMDNV